MLSAIINDLKMKIVPRFDWEELFQVRFCLLDVFPIGKSPTLSQTMNMRVDWKSGNVEGLGHDYAGSFVTDARQAFKGCEFRRNLGCVLLYKDF